MFEKRTKYPIGIDIQERQIFAVQLQAHRQGIAIKGLARAEIDEKWLSDDPVEGTDALQRPLKMMAKNKAFGGRKAVLHIPPQHVISFPIRLKPGRAESLEQAIVRESAAYLPFPIEEAVIDYPSLESVNSGDTREYKAVMIAVHRALIEKYVGLLRQVGFVLEAVDFQVSSLIRLHRHLRNREPGPKILCHLGMTQTLLAIVSGDSILAQRHVPTGLQFLLGKITDNLALSQGKNSAKVMLQKYGLAYQDQQPADRGSVVQSDETSRLRRVIYQILSPQIEGLLHELHKIIGYVRSEAPNTAFEKIYVYGPGILIRKLDDYVAKRINIPAQLLNPLHTMELPNDGTPVDPSEGGPFALAVGLAMRKVAWL
ncbi:MAG: pilus assembly protein PilM [Desulfobacterales bacterium]